MKQQQSGRRAWGAPPPPKPAAERRAAVEAAPPAASAQQAPPAASEPTKPQRGPAKGLLPKLGAGVSPRAGPARRGEQQQQGSPSPPPSRLKQHPQAATVHVQAVAAPQPLQLQQQTAVSPPLLPSVSPNELPLAVPVAPSPPAWLQGRDEEDLVLIGSTAPSFSVAAQQQQLAEINAAPELAVAQPPRRASLLTTHVASEDLPLAALAAASRASSRYSSAGSSLPPSSSGSGRSAREGGTAEGTAAEPYSPDFEEESPASTITAWTAADTAAQGATAPAGAAGAASNGPGSLPRRQPRLDPAEVAVLRESMVELQLLKADQISTHADGGSVLAGEEAAEIPDQVVLQELSSRLGRLNSQKRRVLLEVLSKLDVSAAAAGGATATGAASHGRDGSSVDKPASCRQSENSDDKEHSGSGDGAGSVRPARDIQPAVPVPEAGGQQQPAEAVKTLPVPAVPHVEEAAPVGTDSYVPSQSQPGAAASQSPSKGLLGKLAALRLGRTGSLVGRTESSPPHQSDSSMSGSNATSAPEPVAEAAALGPSVRRQGSLLASGQAGHTLQSMVQQRHRERSRFSVDGRYAAQQALQALQAGGVPAAVGSNGTPVRSSSSVGPALAADALAAFQQQAEDEDDSQPSLAASPTVLALGAWQLLPDALDVASGPGLPAAGQGRASAGNSPGFLIPRCPAGRVLELHISSTWGDQHYVGLAAIELFDSAGQPISLREPRSQVNATPHSINVLPEYTSDPRTPDKLLDGVCVTCDDAHVWLAPFTPGSLHTVRVDLEAAVALGAVRVWNYNKSRIHSLRGARHAEMTLDGSLIFKGELRQAPGNVSEAYQHAELILFADDVLALGAIERYDQRYSGQLGVPMAGVDSSSGRACNSRGSSISGGSSPAGSPKGLDLVTECSLPLPESARSQLARTATLSLMSQLSLPARQQVVSGGRPLTAAFSAGPDLPPAAPLTAAAAPAQRAALQERRATGASSSRGSTAGGSPAAAGILQCKELTMVLLDTWGDSHFMGLAGLQVLGADGKQLPLPTNRVLADPPDLNVFPGHSGDVRTVDKLVDGTNNTMDDTHMWLAPVRRQLSAAVLAACHRHRHGIDRSSLPEAARAYNVITISLEGLATVTGLRLWNYNKNATDTARGVKRMVVLADGVEVSPPGGVMLRRAPGTASFDFGQLIPLTTCWAMTAGTKAGRQRATMQHGSPTQPGSQANRQQQTLQAGLVIQSESVAWACNMPDPVAALDYLQRAAAAGKAAGPGGLLLQQPGENFCTMLPCGFSLRFVLLTTWGDPHYIGLSGVEVQDAVRGPLRIRPDQVLAAPSSVAALPGMAADARTPDKLVDGMTSGVAHHSWLAPLDRQEGNSVLLVLDAPLLLASIKVWNYAKTPSRGVQELEVYLDEQLVWKGLLQRAPESLSPNEDFSQLLCFSEEAAQEAAAAAKRRAGVRRPLMHPSSGASSTGGAFKGPPAADGVEEWCHQQEAVILVNEGQFVAFPPDAAALGPVTARPITAVVAA